MDYNKFFSQEIEHYFKQPCSSDIHGWEPFSRTIIEHNDKVIKVYLLRELIGGWNIKYYNDIYGSVDAGIQAAIKIINSVDSNIITDYKYKHNYYLRLELKKIKPHYQLHSKELIEQFDSLEDYVVYLRDNINIRTEKLKPFFFVDYHYANIMIDKDLNWINIDHDDMLRHGLTHTWDLVDLRTFLRNNLFKATSMLEDYDLDHIQDIWENK